MAAKLSKAPAAAPELTTTSAPDLESFIADEILNELDWQKVRAAMIGKLKERFFNWLSSGNDSPVNISQFPELSALPSSDDGEVTA
jgi:hypothetical protein